MQTPWGASQTQMKIVEGVYWVTTASHGGLMVKLNQAVKLLTPEAHQKGQAFGVDPWICYEEDCRYCIPLYEHPEWARTMEMTATANDFWETISAWDADYLLARGVEPAAKPYEFFRANQLDRKMRQEKHPNLIVAAWGSTPIPGVTKVVTADGKEHFVTAGSYLSRTTPNLLSNCQLVDA